MACALSLSPILHFILPVQEKFINISISEFSRNFQIQIQRVSYSFINKRQKIHGYNSMGGWIKWATIFLIKDIQFDSNPWPSNHLAVYRKSQISDFSGVNYPTLKTEILKLELWSDRKHHNLKHHNLLTQNHMVFNAKFLI